MRLNIILNTRVQFPLEVTLNTQLDVVNAASEIEFRDDFGQVIDAHIEIIAPETGFIRITPKEAIQPGQYAVAVNQNAFVPEARSTEGPIVLSFIRDRV